MPPGEHRVDHVRRDGQPAAAGAERSGSSRIKTPDRRGRKNELNRLFEPRHAGHRAATAWASVWRGCGTGSAARADRGQVPARSARFDVAILEVGLDPNDDLSSDGIQALQAIRDADGGKRCVLVPGWQGGDPMDLEAKIRR
jgi:hypothetical protein